MTTPNVPLDELRLLVREVLRDLLPAISAGGTPEAEPVVIADDDDLNAFALRILDLAADPVRAAGLRAGRLRFRLHTPASSPEGSSTASRAGGPAVSPAGGPAGSAAGNPAPLALGNPVPAQAAPAQAVHRHEKGAVTERHVAAAASAGARLVLGRRAVLTPLARERARACGLTVERED